MVAAAASIARSATRSVRIIALPLTPHCKLVDGKPVVEHLTYYHFVTHPDNKKPNSWSNWAVAKASGLWAGLGKAPEGSWKRRAFVYGERIIDRLDFEELALKSLDPSLGPKLSNLVPHGSRSKSAAPPSPVIPLIYPPSVCTSPLPHLRSLLEKRTPRHKKGFWFWLGISPLTAPFMIIPVIPNFPFFFCVWRSWSHYRAYKASQYLEAFLQQGAIHPEPSAHLDAIYAQHAPPPATDRADPAATAADDKPPPPSDHTSSSSAAERTATHPSAALLLQKEAVPDLQDALALSGNTTFAADVYRALEQARLRLEVVEGSDKSK